MKTKIHLYIPTKTAGYLSCRFCFTISQPDQPDNNAVIGNAGVLGQPHFAGAAVFHGCKHGNGELRRH